MNRASALHLKRLDVIRMPGLSPAFTVEPAPGVNLILGPNESGKSSLARAVRLLLWPDDHAPEPFEAAAVFADADGHLRISRRGQMSDPWQRDGEPTAPPTRPPAHVAASYRLGLLDLHRATTDQVAESLAAEIRRQMAGGFALDPVRDTFRDESRTIKSAWKPLQRALRDLRAQIHDHEDLATEERGLAGLRAELAAAERAHTNQTQLQAALACRRLDRMIESRMANLAALPPGTAQTRDDDSEVLETLNQRIGDYTSEIANLEERLTRHREELAATTIAGDASRLEPLLALAEERSRVAQQAARDLEAAATAEGALRRELAPELLETEAPPASVDAVRLLVTQQGKLSRIGARVEVQEAVLRDLAGPPEADDRDRDAATPPLVDPTPPRPLGLILGTLGLLAAGVLYWLNQSAGAAACAAAGVLLLVFGFGERRRRSNARRRLEEFGRAAGLPLSAGWQLDEARTVIQEVLSRRAAADGARQARATLHGDLLQRQEASIAEHEAAIAQRRELLQKYQQDPDRDTTDLAHEWDRLRLWREEANKHVRARGVSEHEATAAADACQAVAHVLGELGEKTDGTLAGLQAGCRRISDRQTRCENLRKELANLEEMWQGASSRLAGTDDERSRLLARLEIATSEDDATGIAAEVAARVAALPEWRILSEQLQVARDERAREAVLLDDATAAAWGPLPDAELESLLAAAADTAKTRDDLIKRIAALEERVRIARAGNLMETAQAAVDTETDRLADLLDAHRLGEAGRLLLEGVAREHEQDTQPPALREMNALLKKFTEGRFRLLVTTDERGTRFVAMTEALERLELDQLSDGTRAQLLLAARLAFLTTAESGISLPLILDEALTASDPVRFEAVAAALGRLAAASQRQVFYLTSNPGDVGAWRQALNHAGLAEPHLIELGVVRRTSAAATPLQLAAPAGGTVPGPEGHNAVSYALLLGVPALNPWDEPQTAHPFYLCRDNLRLVQRLLTAGVVTMGRWQRLAADLVSAGLFDPDEAALLTARAEVYRHFVSQWRIGRGRPLTAEVLQASGAISVRFMGPARALLDEVGADAAAFLRAVDEGHLPRFRQENKEALQDYLERERYLDDRPILSADELVARIVTAPTLTLPAAAIRQLVFTFIAAVGPPSPRSAESDPTD